MTKTFKPSEFSNLNEAPQSFQIISHYYLETAERLLELIDGDKPRSSGHVFSIIILSVTSIESHLHETIAILDKILVLNGCQKIETIVVEGMKIKFQSTMEKVKALFKFYEIETDFPNSKLYKDISALIDLRNEIIHYRPDFDSYIEYPARLKYIYDLGLTDTMNSPWTTNFNTLKLAKWSVLIANQFNEKISQLTKLPYAISEAKKAILQYKAIIKKL